MELFSRDGHLTAAGLGALVDGDLDDMQNLEAAEHLSFCDACLARYTALLSDDALLTPPAPVRPAVTRRLQERAVLVVFRKVATIAAAACLAVALWGGVVAGGIARAEDRRAEIAAPAQAEGQRLGARLDNALNNATHALNEWLGGMPHEDDASEALQKPAKNA